MHTCKGVSTQIITDLASVKTSRTYSVAHSTPSLVKAYHLLIKLLSNHSSAVHPKVPTSMVKRET